MGCRCFWDSDTDNYASETFVNVSAELDSVCILRSASLTCCFHCDPTGYGSGRDIRGCNSVWRVHVLDAHMRDHMIALPAGVHAEATFAVV